LKAAIIIPARYASTRYPGKPLVRLRDSSGESKTLVQRSWEAALQVLPAADVFVATDDDRIRDCAEGFGAQVIMTSETCRNGTERCAEAVERAGLDADTIVNLQGDAPLTPPWFVSALIETMAADDGIAMATPVLRCDHETYGNFVADRKAGRVGGTTAVFGRDMQALYFSKEVIPYLAKPPADDEAVPVFHHVGVYAYRRAALDRYVAAEEGVLEKLEGLEQLRFLEMGIPIRCVEVEARGRKFWELNNPVDVERIEAIL
jgi:3-deoxy-manno-octulosonate cytidylyltransferase (CMP-KDO synthetase)